MTNFYFYVYSYFNNSRKKKFLFYFSHAFSIILVRFKISCKSSNRFAFSPQLKPPTMSLRYQRNIAIQLPFNQSAASKGKKPFRLTSRAIARNAPSSSAAAQRRATPAISTEMKKRPIRFFPGGESAYKEGRILYGSEGERFRPIYR